MTRRCCGSHQVVKGAGFDLGCDRLVALVDRVRPGIGDRSRGHRHGFVRGRARGVVRRQLGDIGASRDEEETAVAGVCHRAPEGGTLDLAAIRAGSGTGDIDPRSDQLVLQRFLLADGAARSHDETEHRQGRQAKGVMSFHVRSFLSLHCMPVAACRYPNPVSRIVACARRFAPRSIRPAFDVRHHPIGGWLTRAGRFLILASWQAGHSKQSPVLSGTSGISGATPGTLRSQAVDCMMPGRPCLHFIMPNRMVGVPALPPLDAVR